MSYDYEICDSEGNIILPFHQTNGRLYLTLPAGTYKFRILYNGANYNVPYNYRIAKLTVPIEDDYPEPYVIAQLNLNEQMQINSEIFNYDIDIFKFNSPSSGTYYLDLLNVDVTIYDSDYKIIYDKFRDDRTINLDEGTYYFIIKSYDYNTKKAVFK